jgi:hypothetical protein
MVFVIWVSSIVLFCKFIGLLQVIDKRKLILEEVNTTQITVYDTAHTYKATAGVGPFNGSLVEPFVASLDALAPEYHYQVIPYNYFASAYTLVLNPLISTVSESVECTVSKDSCVSYLFTGGLQMVAPWIGHGYADHSMVKIYNAPAIQFDFEDSASDEFDDEDCDVFGQAGVLIGIKFCVVEDRSVSGSLRIGKFG